MIDQEKLENRLDAVQRRTRTRLLTAAECREAVEKAIKEIERIQPPAWMIPCILFEYNPHSVAKAYDFRAKGTRFLCGFAVVDGKLIVTDEAVQRTPVGNSSHIALTVSRQFFGLPNVMEMSEKQLRKFMLALGFRAPYYTHRF